MAFGVMSLKVVEPEQNATAFIVKVLQLGADGGHRQRRGRARCPARRSRRLGGCGVWSVAGGFGARWRTGCPGRSWLGSP